MLRTCQSKRVKSPHNIHTRRVAKRTGSNVPLSEKLSRGKLGTIRPQFSVHPEDGNVTPPPPPPPFNSKAQITDTFRTPVAFAPDLTPQQIDAKWDRPSQQPKLPYVEIPDKSVVKLATQYGESDDIYRAREEIVQFFKQRSVGTKLRQICAPVPYLTPVGENSPDTFPIPPFLIHTLSTMSQVTQNNFGFGLCAPQIGVNYRMFVLRSEAFGIRSAITGIPLVLETTPQTNAAQHPRVLQKQFKEPEEWRTHHLAFDTFTPTLDRSSSPPVNISHSAFEKIDRNYSTRLIDNTPNSIKYPLTTNLKRPTRDIKQLNSCDDSLLIDINDMTKRLQDDIDNSIQLIVNNSHLNVYRGYSVALETIEKPLWMPLLQAFNQDLPSTPIINPRILDIRKEYWSTREACFSFPHWSLFVERPIAVDVEFETLEVLGSPMPSSSSGVPLECSALSSPFGPTPSSTVSTACPSPRQSNIDPDYIDHNVIHKITTQKWLPHHNDVQLVTRRLTLRDIAARAFLHEYDHLDGIQFFDRAGSKTLHFTPPLHNRKQQAHVTFSYPVDANKTYY